MFVPPPIRESNKCNRCGLRYPETESECPNCKDLTDSEVESLKSESQNKQEGNTNLGKLFLYITALIVVGMVIALI